MQLQFFLASQEDLPTIVHIYNESIASKKVTADLAPVSVAARQAWFEAFDASSRPLWKVMADQQLAGWVGLESFYGRPAYHRTAEISIYLDQNFQHLGFGQQMLDFVISQLPRLGIENLVAYVFSENLPSQHLFSKNQFEQWGHLPQVADMGNALLSLDILGRHFPQPAPIN